MAASGPGEEVEEDRAEGRGGGQVGDCPDNEDQPVVKVRGPNKMGRGDPPEKTTPA